MSVILNAIKNGVEKRKEASGVRLNEINSRIEAIRTELRSDNNDLDFQVLETEIKSLMEDKKKIEERQSLQAQADKISEGESEVRIIDKIDFNNSVKMEERQEKKMNKILYRNDKFIDRIQVEEEQRNLDLGKYIKGIVTGNWSGAEAEKRAMLTSATGVLIPEVLSARVIDLARNQSLFSTANVPMIPMYTDNLTISKMKTDPVFKFKAEGEAATESSMELDSVQLKAKTIYGYAYVSLEAIKSSMNLEAVINNAFAQALSQGIDNAMLYGQYNGSTYDTFAPAGIMRDSNINVINAVADEGYDSIVKAIGKVRTANGMPTVMGINAQTDEMFSLLKDTTGQYLAAPKSVTDLNKIVSNQLEYDATNGSDGLVFDPNAMIIGMQQNVIINLFEGDTESIKKGLVCFRIYSMIDCVTLQPKHICKVAGIK